MGMIFSLLAMVCGLASFVCAILVLIKLFTAEGPIKGVLGILCGIYTFVWGWQNANRFNLRQVMQIWTIAFIAYLVCIALMMATGAMSGS
jgi:hypothetical protein